MSDPRPETLSAYELSVRLLEAAQSLSATLEQINANLAEINATLKQAANDDPLSRVERALERAPDALGFDPFTDRNTFDNRFAGRPIEETTR